MRMRKYLMVLSCSVFVLAGCGQLSDGGYSNGTGGDNPFSVTPRAGESKSSVIEHIYDETASDVTVNDIRTRRNSRILAGQLVPEGDIVPKGFVKSFAEDGSQEWIYKTNSQRGAPQRRGGTFDEIYVDSNGDIFAAGQNNPPGGETRGVLVHIDGTTGDQKQSWSAPVYTLSLLDANKSGDGFVVAGSQKTTMEAANETTILHVASMAEGQQQWEITKKVNARFKEPSILSSLPDRKGAVIAGTKLDSETDTAKIYTGIATPESIEITDRIEGSITDSGAVMSHSDEIFAIKESSEGNQQLISIELTKSNQIDISKISTAIQLTDKDIRIDSIRSAQNWREDTSNSLIGVANDTKAEQSYIFQYFPDENNILMDQLALPNSNESSDPFELRAISRGPSDGTVAIAGNVYPSEGVSNAFVSVVNGFRTQSAPAPNACESDADCGSGEVCESGVCSADNDSTSQCRSDTDCSAGQICESGSCVDDSGGNTCQSDADCGTGEFCDDGICKSNSSTQCTSDADCSSGEVCEAGICTSNNNNHSCSSDADCSSGQICESGQCVEDDSGGSTCQSDADCGTNQICESGSCVDDSGDSSCQSDADCGTDQICESGSCIEDNSGNNNTCQSDADCGPGEICEVGTCVEDDSESNTCQSDADCGTGSHCVQGTCTSNAPENQCSDDSDCDSGDVCVNGWCVAQ